jgi:hypothetical protein
MASLFHAPVPTVVIFTLATKTELKPAVPVQVIFTPPFVVSAAMFGGVA